MSEAEKKELKKVTRKFEAALIKAHNRAVEASAVIMEDVELGYWADQIRGLKIEVTS